MIRIEMAYATPEKQILESLEVPIGCTLGEALQQSPLSIYVTEPSSVGIFSKIQPLSYVLQPHDRIEIYRPLTADPMKKRQLRQDKNPLKKIPR
jgi:putative ubiquitin-RnfH superfamily antitoxin RatB of RatAB toxin-antitoxin module